MPTKTRQMKLGTFATYWGHPAAWRHRDVPAGASVQWSFIRRIAQIAESGLLDFLFIADSAYITGDSIPPHLSRTEPLSALSAISGATQHIGLVGTFTTSFSEPFTTARQLASLDLLSGGRAGWNAVTSALEGLGRNHGHDKLHDHDTRYRIASEYIDVVKGLWNSWEDDAFVREKASGRYIDPQKLHVLNHVGEYFRVQGPLNVERSAQGHPVIFQAGASEAGRALAVAKADAIFAGPMTLRLGTGDYYGDIKRQAKAAGRDPDTLLVLPSITPIIGETSAAADEAYEEINALIEPLDAVRILSRYFSYFDFSQYDLDAPFPDIGDAGKNSFQSWSEYYVGLAREEKLTLRQLAARAANPKGEFVGTAEQVADRMQHYFERGSIDGFILEFSLQPKGISDFVDKVVPLLQERGLFRTEYEAETLRGNLGLDFPQHPAS